MSKIDFSHIKIQEGYEPLVKLDPSEFVLEPMYYKWGFNQDPDMCLRKSLVEKLRKAKNKLPPGFKFKIWDGYRSIETQTALWEDAKEQTRKKYPEFSEAEVENEARKFIAIPDDDKEAPPPHNTGGAVDLTLFDHGSEVEMGTKFDEFFEKAYPFYYHNLKDPSKEEQKIKANRELLFKTMLSVGFRQDTDEWWHFDYGDQLWAYTLNKPCAIYGAADDLNSRQ